MVGSIVGTPGYIPPEQAFGMRIDGRSDLYALACVAWWLLTATEVYSRAVEEEETLRAHVTEPVPALRPRVNGWLPQGLEDVILACLAKDPDDRPHDARDLIKRLRAIEVPTEHAWTDERAASWWQNHQPTAVATLEPSAATSVAPRTIMPANLDASRGGGPPPMSADKPTQVG